MKAKSLGAVAVVTGLCVMLSACGGSSDDGAGSVTPFSVSPTTKGVTGSSASGCYIGYAGDFVISGGTPPYSLVVSDTDAMALDRNVVSQRNGIFVLNFIGGVCLDPGTVSIFDAQGNRITVTVTNKLPGST